jgi:hypothetical protein
VIELARARALNRARDCVIYVVPDAAKRRAGIQSHGRNFMGPGSDGRGDGIGKVADLDLRSDTLTPLV